MADWIAYILGLATLPGLALTTRGAFLALSALNDRGFTFEVKLRRRVDEIDDYMLRHEIWWERAFGPIFVGGWYHEKPQYGAPSVARFNRWVAFGSVNGPCFMAFRKRDLGAVEDQDG